MDLKDFVIIIPSRYGSSRFPGKPLAKIGGVEMIVRVCRQAEKTGFRTVVATDDSRIYECVVNSGHNAVMTRVDHKSGTDRIREAWEKWAPDARVVLNVQGDEPFINPEQIKGLACIFDDPEVDIATLVTPWHPEDGIGGLEDPNLVKVVTASNGDAVYFSRNVIPYVRNAAKEDWPRMHKFLTHIGMYAYRSAVLKRVTDMPQGTLEMAESLEQLRWLEAGLKIRAMEVAKRTLGIDTLDDLKKAEELVLLFKKKS